MNTQNQYKRKLNLTAMRRLSGLQGYRRSFGLIPNERPKMQLTTTTQFFSSRKNSLGKTKRAFNNRIVEKKSATIVKNYGDKNTYFDEFLSEIDILRQFKMMSHIGKGCFSTVSLAIQKQSNRPYALKVYEKIDSLDWYRLDSIKREIRNLGNLNHENVVHLYHTFKDKKKIYLLMDNGGKQSLSGLLRKSKTFSEERAKGYFKQALEAIGHCHEKGVCHRDLKPENILVDEQGKIKVIDFGFSASTKCSLKTFCGTPPFMAPEITKKIPYSGEAVDIWALGVMLYQMIVGKLPFRATNEAELFRLIQAGKYPIVDQLSKNVRQILQRMLKTDPKQRISARQVLMMPWFA